MHEPERDPSRVRDVKAPSFVGRLARLVPGVRTVHAQVARYARSWEEANAIAMDATGPLWVVLGDSTAQGIGAPSYEEGYVGQLHAMLDARAGEAGRWRVVNLSRSGAKAVDVLDTQLPRLEALRSSGLEPALVTCAVGANDLIPTPLDELISQLREIIRRLPPGAVIATMPQGLRPRRAVVVNEVITTEAPAAGLRVADVWTRTGPPWRGKYASDGFHPGALGYRDWAAAFAEALGPEVTSGE